MKKNLVSLVHQIQKYAKVKIGVSQVIDDLSKIHSAYDTAKTAIDYSNPDQVICLFESVELYSLLKKKESPEAQRFSHRIFDNVNSKLVHTLEEYLRCNQQLSLTAEVLDIHRHTLTYRLNQIFEITGYNPTVFQDAVVLQIALWLNIEEKKKE